MPKRKVTRTPAQIAASRRNLVKARKARQLREGKIPTGKNVLLVHRTSVKAAESILAQQKFNDPKWKYGSKEGGGKIYFAPASSKSGAKFYSVFGTGAVSIRVSRKLMKPDLHRAENKYYGAVTVDVKHLAGVKIRRHI
jgi:hypothetical protein